MHDGSKISFLKDCLPVTILSRMIYSFYHKAAISATAPSITLCSFFDLFQNCVKNKFKIDEQSMKLYKKIDVQEHPKIDPEFFTKIEV